jgi:methylglutamate dehydrogenase subunit D
MSSEVAPLLKLRSPWAGEHRGRFGRQEGAPGLRLQLIESPQRLGIEAWPGQRSALEAALVEVIGCGLPAAGASSQADGVCVLSTAPGRWQVLLEGEAAEARLAALRARLAGIAAAVDLTHGFAVVDAAGAQARDVLAKLIRPDLHPDVFGPGAVMTTELHGLSVQLRCLSGDSYQLAAVPSFAHSLLHALVGAGEGVGVEVCRP